MDIVLAALSLVIVLVLVVWVSRRMDALEALNQPEVEASLPANPGGCTKTSHEWRRRPHLISGYEEVFYCAKNCGSTLRHRVK